MVEISLVRQVIHWLKTGDKNEILALLEEMQPADIAELVEEMSPGSRRTLFNLLKGEQAALVLNELDLEIVNYLLTNSSPVRLAEIFRSMSTDDAADLLGDVSARIKAQLLSLMGKEDAGEVEELLAYKEDSAGGIMTTEFVAIRQNLPASKAIEVLRDIAPDAETVYYVFVVNDRGQLVGVISLRELIVAAPETLIADIMHRNVISVNVHEDQEEVARIVSKYDFLAVPVTDDADVLLGIITVDDIIDVIQEETTEDFLRLAGASEADDSQSYGLRILSSLRARMPWLLITMIEGLIAGYVLGGIETQLQTFVALAFFIPLLTGLGGNVGTQSSTLTVRGLATGQIKAQEIGANILREGLLGVCIGTVFGLLVGAVAFTSQKNLMFGVVVGISMLGNMVTAAVMGTLVPLLFKRVGIDPAVASAPFITASIDITGLLIYSFLATTLISYLV